MDFAACRPLRCALYCRISLSRFGDTVKVDDQEKLNRAVADMRGWSVVPDHVFKDNSKSAWRRDRKRPGWDSMLAAVNRGEIDAIVVYHGDRLIRQPRDLEDLIDLADRKGIRLASPTGERDLDNPDDRYILRIEAAGNCRESDNTSRRLKRHYDRLAEQGIARLGGRGGRAFGFNPDGRTVNDDDAAMLREVADRILSGEAIGEICRNLNRRKYRTAAGNEWAHDSLKKLMLRPRLAGLLTRHGVIVGPAVWPAILDRDLWESVCAVLTRKAGDYGYTTNVSRYLLSGIALCGTCGQPATIRHNARGATLLGYGCVNGSCSKKVHRSAAHLDPYVEGQVLGRLQDPRIRERATAPDAKPLIEELGRLEARRERKLAEFADDDDPLAADVLRVTVRKIDEQVADVRGRLSAAQASHTLDGLWGITYEDWERLPLSRRRAAVRALVKVTILAAGRRGPGFDPSTVLIEDVG